MATIFRVRGLRFVIYSNDHPPPHIHVIGADREARIALGDGRCSPSVITNDGLSRGELAVALFETNLHGELLLRRWREIHGDA